jgi:fatty-acyl-CoA synthase|tara:strand:- start:2912 stop:3286 length:375 start_codon:yes stop_codon:yes gene_type:complete
VKTGDVATRDEDGYVYTIDRIKDMPILADENVYLAAIENVILAHPSGAVIGQPSDRWGESPLAVGVVMRADGALYAEGILDHCDGRLAKFKVSESMQLVDEIQHHPTGEVLKRILRGQFSGSGD